jgi:PAS domain S-box-containing protein
MQLQLPPAHRLARINYPTRSGAFAFSFLVVVAVLAERGFSAGTLVFGVISLLIYPHLAYLHASLAVNSKRAEFRNLTFDSVLMGLWAAQLHFALWPACGALLSVSLNNAVCGGSGRFLSGLCWFAAAALLWAMVQGAPFEPVTGPLVTGMCFVGIIGYVGSLAIFFHDQNSVLMRTRNVLRTSEQQFRFIADHGGDLVSVLTPEHRFLYASPSHQRYFQSAKFGDGADWLELVHTEDRERGRAFLDLLCKSPRSERARLRMMAESGHHSMIECEGNPVREESGKLRMIVLFCREVNASSEPEVASVQADQASGR